MRKYFLHVRVLVLIALGAFVFRSPDVFSDQRPDVETERESGVAPKAQQDAMFNLLKGVTALKYIYAQAVAADSKRYAVGSSDLEVTFNPDNAQKILETVAVQTIKELQDYENYLLKLIKEIDDSSPDKPIATSSLEKTLKSLWFEYVTRSSTESIKLAQSWRTTKSAVISALFAGAAPLIGNLFYPLGRVDSARLNGMCLMVISFVFTLGGLLGWYTSDSPVDLDEHTLEGLTALAEQLEMVASAEELFNAALVGQKRRELLRKKAVPGTDGLLADY